MGNNSIIEKGIENFHRLERFKDLDILLNRIGDSQFVLLGESSHGTSEFYKWRTEITKRLINEKGFSFIAVEGDWPDCYISKDFLNLVKMPMMFYIHLIDGLHGCGQIKR
jgi:hypothetical protein